MKIAHLAIITPRKCGLYETTRELVSGLRELGVDSRLVDPAPKKNPVGWKGEEDRGVPVANLEWAKEADLFINHSGLGELEELNKPVIHVAHGRPRHSFLSEASGGAPIYSYHYANNSKWIERLVIMGGSGGIVGAIMAAIQEMTTKGQP